MSVQQDIVFSSDGTIFVCGFYMGIVVSIDDGMTFEEVWAAEDPTWTTLDLAISPTFETDGIVALLVDTTDGPADFWTNNYFIYVSSTCGSSWRRLGSNPSTWSNIVLTAGTPPTLVAVKYGGSLHARPAQTEPNSLDAFRDILGTRHRSVRPSGVGRSGLNVSPDGQTLSSGFR